MLRHKRYGSQRGDSWADGGFYVHARVAGANGAWLSENIELVMWEGRDEFLKHALTALNHPTNGEYAFALTHSVQNSKYVRVLTCGGNTGIRKCSSNSYQNIPEYAEVVFASYPEAADGGAYNFPGGLNPANAAQMTQILQDIGFRLVYNDAEMLAPHFADDDGSFLLKHANLSMIATPNTGGSAQLPLVRGEKLVWRSCPSDCGPGDFTREDFLTWGFVFENEAGEACLPAGV